MIPGRALARWLLAGPLLLSGCATAALQYGRDGLAPVDRTVRADLAAGRYGSAYDAALGKDARVRDRLLRALSVGALGLYASRTDSSVWALDRAWTITEDRWTRHVSSGVASAVINDYVLPYTPGPTERLFIPFYGALSWLARGDRDDAAVEARRLVQLLGEAPAAPGSATDGEVKGVLHYVAGAVFEAAGDRSAADVAYRNAARLVTIPALRDTSVADSLCGDVVVVIEQGFVGHPVPRDETIWVSQGELTDLRYHDDDRALRAANRVGLREGKRGFVPIYGPGFIPVYGPGYGGGRLDVGVSINWPEFRDGREGFSPVVVRAPTDAYLVAADGNVSRAVRADFERGQPARFARALLRAATRATLVKAAGDQLAKAGDDTRDDERPRDRRRDGKRDDRGNTSARVPAPGTNTATDDTKSGLATAGRVLAGLGLFALAVTSEVNDQPDLRSWNLLPHDLRVLRLRLPAGEQDVQATVGGEPVAIGRAQVRPGQVTVMTYRSFGTGRS